MDLLTTVRKEGSRGGTGDFKWSDVQASSRRENYLGHSLMAPVGRWQQGRDLNWYAKSGENTADDEDQELRAARERKEELKRVKEAEEDAMARALGLPVPDRNNPNLQALGDKKTADKVLKDLEQDQALGNERGIGYGALGGNVENTQVVVERIDGNAESEDKELRYALKEYKRRHTDNKRRRSRSTSRDRDRRHRKRDRSRDHHRHRHSSRERDHRHTRRNRSRSSSASKPRYEDRDRRHHRDRSRSPYHREGKRQEQERRIR